MTDDQWTDLRERLERGMELRGSGSVLVHFKDLEPLVLDWRDREEIPRLGTDHRTGTDG